MSDADAAFRKHWDEVQRGVNSMHRTHFIEVATSPLLRVVIPGEPVAWARTAANTRGSRPVFFERKKPRDWRALAVLCMKQAMAGREPFEGALSLRVRAFFSCPKSQHKKRSTTPRQAHAKKPDASNIVKLLEDAGNGIVFGDDAQLAHVEVVKIVAAQGEPPRVEFTLAPFDEALLREGAP